MHLLFFIELRVVFYGVIYLKRKYGHVENRGIVNFYAHLALFFDQPRRTA